MTIELEDGKPPEWMIALENKQRRHHKLAHEVGAGAPCLNCSNVCLGLDLHFWRKICRNCKCKKEDHDVKEEQSHEQFEILFGDSFKGSDRVKQLSLDLKFKLDDIFNAKEAQIRETNESASKSEDDLVFDWIPTDVPVNLASEYLQQLPLEKLPIAGSAGAMLRRQQLQKQMPLHDFKVNNCHDLTVEETKAFTDYVDNLKNNVVGKGQITKIQEIENETPTNFLKLPFVSNTLNSSPKPFKPTYETKSENILEIDDLPPPPLELLQPEFSTPLKTPSAFVPYKQFIEQHKRNINEMKTESTSYTLDDMNYNKQKENSAPVSEISAQYAQMSIKDHVRNLDSENNNLYSNEEGEENLKPSDIIRKLNAQQTINGDEKSDMAKNLAKHFEKMTPKTENKNVSPLNNVIKNIDGRFLKLGTPEQFQALSSYVPNTPQLSNSLVNPGSKQCISKIHFDNSKAYSDEFQNSIQQVYQSPVERIGDIQNMQNCHECKLAVFPGQVVVLAERAGMEAIWHPQCFICVHCKELLVDLIYFFHNGQVYCGRHYAEVLQIPRCFACDELIFVKEYTVAEGQSFHVKHFCCFECDIPLAGMQYVPKNDNPICLSCYEVKYGKKCHSCKKIIKAGDSGVAWKELSWHATAFCFKCIQCSKSLLGGKFSVKNDKPVCSKECMIKIQIDL